MEIATYRIGDTIRPGQGIQIAVYRRQGDRVVLGVEAPVGVPLIFDGAPIRPQRGTAGACSYLFSLDAICGFEIGPFSVRVWLPGESVPLAADCSDWLHVGIAHRLTDGAQAPFSLWDDTAPVPAPVFASPLSQAPDGCRPFSRSA